MRNQCKKSVIILFSILLGQTAYSQVESRKSVNVAEPPEFFVDALSFSSGDSSSSRVDVYVQIPHELLQFIKKDNDYVSRYEVTINILAGDKSSVSEKIWSDEISVSTFDETVSKLAYGLTQRSISVSPGIYTLRAQLRDNEAGKNFVIVKNIIVGNYTWRTLALSDIMLVNRVTASGERKTIVPNVSGNLANNAGTFFIFFEIYSPRSSDSIELHYLITDYKGKEQLNKYQLYTLAGSRAQVITRFDSVQYTTGAYTLTVEAKSLTTTDDPQTALKQKTFVIRWGNMPLSISDLDVAIRQLRYIAKGNEYDEMADADSEEEKRRLFDEFWRKRDPNPDTKRNEFMEEYYSRVEYANQHFSHYIPGWRTDMGMVFILLGSPNNVERHPFDINAKPYEVWSYYDYNRSIVFVDETGFGDYRLLNPSVFYDMLQRLKY